MPTPDWMNVPDPGPEPPRPDEFEVGSDPTGMVRRRIQRDHDEWLRNQRLFILSKVSQELVETDGRDWIWRLTARGRTRLAYESGQMKLDC